MRIRGNVLDLQCAARIESRVNDRERMTREATALLGLNPILKSMAMRKPESQDFRKEPSEGEDNGKTKAAFSP